MTELYRSTLFVNVGDNPFRDRPGREWLLNPYRVHQRIMWAIDGAIPSKEARKQSRRNEGAALPLFRIFAERAQAQDGGLARPRIVVQTTVAPKWNTAFATDAHHAPFLVDVAATDVQLFTPELQEGEIRAFQVLANPSSRISAPPPPGGYKAFRASARARGDLTSTLPRGKRRSIRDDAAILRWLAGKLRDSGFESVPLESTGRSYNAPAYESATKEGFYVRETHVIRAWKRKGERSRPALTKQAKAHTSQIMTVHAALFEGIVRVTDPEMAMDTIRRGIGPAKGLGCGLLFLGKPL